MNKPAAIVTDIEGTTSSIDFVHAVLFPYAREALPEFLREHARDAAVAGLLDDVRRDIGEPDAGIERLTTILRQWIDEDRKATPLKELQGLVWENGYRSGDFTGHVYEDAARRLGEWRRSGIALYAYSSGSVKAQQLLFAHSDAGDLTSLFNGYFDTRIGHKRQTRSYEAIANSIAQPPAAVLFLSDVVAELDAAAAAGMGTIQVAREPDLPAGRHPLVHDFDEIIF